MIVHQRLMAQLGLLLGLVVLLALVPVLGLQALSGEAAASAGQAVLVPVTGPEEAWSVPSARTEAQASCPAQMTDYWKLDEAPNVNVYDNAQNSNYRGFCGAGRQCPSSEAKGRVNGAQLFDGSSTGIDVPVVTPDPSFNWPAGTSFSVELWMKGVPGETCAGSEAVQNEVFIGRNEGTTGPLHWWLGCTAGNGHARFQLGRGSAGGVIVQSTVAISDGAWHHLVGVQNVSANRTSLYVDGVEVGSGPAYTNDLTSTNVALNIGWLNYSSSTRFHFRGALDEVALYRRALNASEIQAHYNDGEYCGGDYAPRITSAPVTSVKIEEPYAYDVNAIGKPAPTFSLGNHPAGMTINSTSGLISWTPTEAQVGLYNVEVQAQNSKGNDSQIFTVLVIDKYFAPQITSSPVTFAQPNKPYTYDVTASGEPAPTFSLQTNPAGMAINSTSGLISWTPTSAQLGSHPVVVQATNLRGTDAQTFTIVVADKQLIYLPLITK
jgi:hypothetical protein